MAKRPITIHSPCVTTPDQHVHIKVGDQVRWKVDHGEVYLLKLPGKFFQNKPDPFELLVFGVNWTEYYQVVGNPGDKISNYIYGLAGNCLLVTADGPPDIIIDSTTVKGPKKPGPKKPQK